MKTGTLYIVATPIGNLKDITIRSIEILKSVDLILCEDTRTTGILLKEYDIKNKLMSFNARMEGKKIDQVIEKLLSGYSIALVSDAGTPCISDPGIRLVNEANKNDITVSGVPGANAAITALSISGLPTDSFYFFGFLPQKKGRKKSIDLLVEIEQTIVLYESTYRIEKLLNELNAAIPNREIAVCRELTKKFEEIWHGSAKQLLDELPNKNKKGEFVVIIAPKNWDSNN